MFNIFINDKKYEVSNTDYTLLQFCENLGHSIPRFCYHEALSIAGNCRMCLVELEGASKPVVACSTSLEADMVFYTNNEVVKYMREAVLEFLLINHPLDCPICDQGGECDLQDQTMIFGSDRGRFYGVKRSVEDKYFGPFIKTIMTRCIHCTRCIRYFDEIVGLNSIGTMGRGVNTEISSYISLPLLDEVSGNVIDLCPVGALTSKPYAFSARPWELVSYESIDILDSLNSNIKVDVKGNIVMRILPKINYNLNEEWITDFIRFSYDGFRNERLTFPMSKIIKNNNILFEYCSWNTIFFKLKYLFSNYNFIHLYIGDAIDLYSSFLLKYWIDSTSNIIYSYFDDFSDNSLKNDFLLTSSLDEFLQFSNFLILKLDLKKNISVLNIKLKKMKWRYQDDINIYYIGSNNKFNYKYKQIGLSNVILLSILKGKHFFCNNLLQVAFNFVSITNLKFKLDKFKKYNNNIVLNNVSLKSQYIHYNYLGIDNHNILNNSYINTNINNINLYYLINYDKYINYVNSKYNYIIYQGTHGSSAAMDSNLILPCTFYMETQGLYMNLEGKIQINEKILYSPGISLSFLEFFNDVIFKIYLLLKVNVNYLLDLFNSYINYINFIRSSDNLKSNAIKDIKLVKYNNYYNNNYTYDKIYFVAFLEKSTNNFFLKKNFIKNYKY